MSSRSQGETEWDRKSEESTKNIRKGSRGRRRGSKRDLTEAAIRMVGGGRWLAKFGREGKKKSRPARV